MPTPDPNLTVNRDSNTVFKTPYAKMLATPSGKKRHVHEAVIILSVFSR